MPSIIDDKLISNKELNLLSKMHKAITIIQLKIEGKIIKKFKDFEMEDRLLLHKIDFKKKVVIINKKEYKLLDTNFPTIDPNDPYKLTNYEEEVIDKLKTLYLNNEKLQEHIRFLFNKGSMYLKHNSNLLYHGCIPTDENGDFTSILINNEPTNGKKLINFIERNIREGYFNRNRYKDFDFRIELMWYLWCGKNSPLFGKTKMATFERYFIQDEKTHEEKKNAYYKYRDDENYCNKVLKEFNLDPSSSRIINGHVPVKVKKGESPIKANSKLLVIDGGFSKAYQKHTGIAGYTLIYSSYGYSLISHESFESKKRAVEEEKDIYSSSVILEYTQNRKRVKDTDVGYKISENIKYLEQLLIAYRNGFIKEKK
jgi:fructose-1,6-bisphosphatase-3